MPSSLSGVFGLLPARASVAAVLFLAACARHPAADGGPSAATSTAHATSSAPPPASADLVAQGAALYARYCALCHAKDATGYAADNAPSLVTRTFLESASDGFIADAIRNGRPSTAMGAYGKSRQGPLEEADIRALLAFLRSHGPQPVSLPHSELKGDAVRGAVLFHDNCERCHGTPTERKTAVSLFNPQFLAQATPDFLRYAIVNGRPPTPMPAFGTELTPAQDIEDLVAFIGSKTVALPAPTVAKVPENLPVVLNPKGKPPNFTLREDRFVPADEVKQALAEHRKLVIVDARSPADWIAFHIPGAISAPYYNGTELDRIPNDGTWVLAYCACPHHASGAVVDALRQRGYKHTAVIDEGILVWKSRGYPLAGEAVDKAP
ncbi:MAG TPA: c-type cytochrome [Polyangiaceae bacterium]|nr:c-type cytochrome [Polyangiaceae bacterium]